MKYRLLKASPFKRSEWRLLVQATPGWWEFWATEKRLEFVGSVVFRELPGGFYCDVYTNRMLEDLLGAYLLRKELKKEQARKEQKNG